MTIKEEFIRRADDTQACHLMRFFKTGKGEYGEGDKFLGVRVPETRSIVKRYRKDIRLTEVKSLIASEYHEIRLAGLLFLIEMYLAAKKAGDSEKQCDLVEYYISVIDRGNNWDLVDLVSYKLLGDWLVTHPSRRTILDRLAEMNGHLWHQRVAIVSTMAMLRHGEYDDTLRIAAKLLHHSHDLIHKAVGWLLREMGKRGGHRQLLDFLDCHAAVMPRTMLRYAIEHFSAEDRRKYLSR